MQIGEAGDVVPGRRSVELRERRRDADDVEHDQRADHQAQLRRAVRQEQAHRQLARLVFVTPIERSDAAVSGARGGSVDGAALIVPRLTGFLRFVLAASRRVPSSPNRQKFDHDSLFRFVCLFSVCVVAPFMPVLVTRAFHTGQSIRVPLRNNELDYFNLPYSSVMLLLLFFFRRLSFSWEPPVFSVKLYHNNFFVSVAV